MNKQTLTFKALNELIVKADSLFEPSLSSRVNLSQYANKLYKNAEIIYKEENNKIKGLNAFYCNDAIGKVAFISIIFVFPDFKGMGIGSEMLRESMKIAKKFGMKQIQLEVDNHNSAINFYLKVGFVVSAKKVDSLRLTKKLDI